MIAYAEITQNISQNIRNRRLLFGFTQTVLGNAIGLTFQSVQKIENGKTRVSAERLYQYAQALDTSPAYFIDGTDEKLAPGEMKENFGLREINLHLGRRVRRRRRLLGLTQRELGVMVGVKFQQIHKYECGANAMSATNLFRCGEALGVPLSYFYDGLPRTIEALTPIEKPAHQSHSLTSHASRARGKYKIEPRI